MQEMSKANFPVMMANHDPAFVDAALCRMLAIAVTAVTIFETRHAELADMACKAQAENMAQMANTGKGVN